MNNYNWIGSPDTSDLDPNGNPGWIIQLYNRAEDEPVKPGEDCEHFLYLQGLLRKGWIHNRYATFRARYRLHCRTTSAGCKAQRTLMQELYQNMGEYAILTG